MDAERGAYIRLVEGGEIIFDGGKGLPDYRAELSVESRQRADVSVDAAPIPRYINLGDS